MKKTRTQKLLTSVGFYPITGFYLGATGVAMLVASGRLGFAQGLGALAFLAVLALLLSNHRELKQVHRLVNGTTTALLARVGQLEVALADAAMLLRVGHPEATLATDSDRDPHQAKT